MYVSINGVGKNKSVYIQQPYHKPDDKTPSRIIRRFGRYDELLARFGNDEEKMKAEDRIRAHFLTCFLSLLVYRLLEKKMSEKYTCEELLNTLRSMQLIRLNKESAYISGYVRTDITDDLHETFGFRTDWETMTKLALRSAKKSTKEKRKKKCS